MLWFYFGYFNSLEMAHRLPFRKMLENSMDPETYVENNLRAYEEHHGEEKWI